MAAWRTAAFVLLMLLTSSLKCKRGADLTQEGNWEVSVLLMSHVKKCTAVKGDVLRGRSFIPSTADLDLFPLVLMMALPPVLHSSGKGKVH